jgi:hypothetical protein
MIRSRGLEDKMRRQRADAKTLDNLFRRRIETGANCSPFVSQAILQTAKDVFPLDPQQLDSQLGLGQVKLLRLWKETGHSERNGLLWQFCLCVDARVE